MITLFSERPEQVQKPYTFAASVVLHIVGVILLGYGLLSAPKIRTYSAADRLALRHLDLHSLEAQMQRAKLDMEYPQIHPKPHTLPPEKSAAAQQAMHQVVQAPPGPQTLLQPDLPKPITLTEVIPVPTVVIWNGMKTLEKTIVAPVPLKPAAAIIKPSVKLPNNEQNLADIAIAAAKIPVPAQPILPSTTTPVVISGPKPTPAVPVTTAAGSTQPTSAAVMSLSDSHLADGAVTLPPVNESASSNSPGALSPGQVKGSAQTGQAGPSDKQGGAAGAGDNRGDRTSSGKSASGQTDFGQGNQLSAAHISRSITGQFGAIVVGSSLEDQFPDMPPLWTGRLSYTVYLPVGLAKSWILQYALPRAGEAAAAGNIVHIEAPWPYNIVRPNIPPNSIDADAIMIRGFVNQAGRFEALSLVFPPQFAQAQFVLTSLAQWQWRPATQNGQKIKVEVLLIIPEEQD
ncbi:MAG: hypothetical protein WAK26_19340 [Terracidiphilus sp.]